MLNPVVGKTVDSWCARCKLMLAHTIEAIVKDKITRAHCNTCGAQHAYRPNIPGSKTRRTTAAGGRSSAGASAQVNYQELLRGKAIENARAYKTSEQFRPKELIHHPTFGLGVVVAVRDSNKVDVGFNDRLRTLVHRS